MANSKDNLKAYGKSFIGFDEPSGNAMDSIGGWTGTLYNSPVRVVGWNGKGNAMSFNGTNQYVQFNDSIIPTGTKSIRLKYKVPSFSTTAPMILLSNREATTGRGIQIWIDTSGKLNVGFAIQKTWDVQISSQNTITSPQWRDLLVTWDGTTNADALKVYLDDMSIPLITGTVPLQETVPYSGTLFLGRIPNSATNFLNGQLDSIEIYDRVISPILDKYLVQHNSQYKYHNGTAWQTTTATEANFKQYGMSQLSQITEAQWKELTGAKSLVMWSDFPDKKWANAVLNIEPTTANHLMGASPEVLYYTDSGTTDIIIETETEPYSVYDYISETPSALVYMESTEDIAVSTATEPFDIYDEFGESVEVLYYTDNETVTNADLILEANWSPIDELDGDLEVVTWTDEEKETAKKKLEMNALPVPQFVYPITVKNIKNGLQALFAKDLSSDTRARFLLTPNNTTWYTWKQDNFVPITLTNENITNEGLTAKQLSTFSPTQLEAWTQTSINIGVFLVDDIRGNNVSKVSEIGYSTELYSDTPKVEDINFYILNTTATINVELNGLTLTGQVDDADMTRVQYRVILNDAPYYPDNGAFTPLSAPPLNIDIAFRSDEIKIGDWNTVRVEFQDSFGTMDYWEAKFVGQYAGLMFQDESGNYYSSDIGEVLQYLDFGQILTGQVSIVHEVKVENTYGFDLTDVKIAVNTNQFAQGLSVQLGTDPENMQSVKTLSLGDLLDTASKSFFIRLASSIDAIPNDSKTFNIVATANRKLARN